MSENFSTDDFSAEYLNSVNQDEKAAAVAWALRQTGEARPNQAPAPAEAPVEAPADQAEALMAGSLQAGQDYEADFDPLRASREAVFGPGGEGKRAAAHAIARDVASIPRGIGHGAIEGVNEFIKTASEFSDWATENNIPGAWLLGAESKLTRDYLRQQGIPPMEPPQLPNFTAPDSRQRHEQKLHERPVRDDGSPGQPPGRGGELRQKVRRLFCPGHRR